MILRFEPLEGRQLMAASALPDLTGTSLATTGAGDWGQTIQATGTIANIGTAPLTTPTQATIFASPTNTISSNSLPLATIAIPAGLAPGQTQSFQQAITLPPSPLAGMGMNSPLFIDMQVDPQGAVTESNRTNQQGQGMNLDESIVQITPAAVANLIGKSFTVDTPTATWGESINVTAQIENYAQGTSPATRAKVVLTPPGQTPGGPGDVTIGNIAVPPLAPFQTINLVQLVTLPAAPPASLGPDGSYYLSMIQDADHATSPLVQGTTMQGVGLDEAVINIPNPPASAAATTTTSSTTSGSSTTTTTTTSSSATALADLAATTLNFPETTLNWGQGYQISTTVQNIGQGPSAPTTVEFLLTDTGTDPSQGYYLGEATLGALAPGSSQGIVQAIKLPNRLPYGAQVGPLSYGRVVAIIDPENVVNETTKSNNDVQSAPVALKLLWGGTNSNVPTAPPVRSSQPLPTTTATTVATTKAITKAEAAAPKVKKLSAAQALAAEIRTQKVAAARLRAQRAAARKKPDVVRQLLVHQQTDVNNNIIDLLKKL